MDRTQFGELVDKLVALCEDRDELRYWLSIYDDLDQDQKEKLVNNLQNELEVLSTNTMNN